MGGIKEKLIGALRAGVKTVLLPAQNRKDVKDLPQEVKDGLEIIHVRYVVSSRLVSDGGRGGGIPSFFFFALRALCVVYLCAPVSLVNTPPFFSSSTLSSQSLHEPLSSPSQHQRLVLR